MTQPDTDKRLEKFVRYFAELFESYFSEYYRRLIEKSPNAGKFVQLFEETVGIGKSGGEVLEGAPKASTLIALDLLVKIIKMKSSHANWNKLKKLAPKLLAFGENNQMYRNDLIKGAGHIFAHFEAQFINVTSDTGWEYAIRKIAEDAVNRVISHLRNSDMGIDLEAMSKGVILGESKRYSNSWGIPNLHKGHSINLQGQGIKTTDMFKNLGVKTNDKYYVPNVKKHVLPSNHGAWFRRMFEWESTSTYELVNTPPNSHTYVLHGPQVEEKLESIKQIVDKEQSNEITTKELDEMRKDAKEYADDTMKILERNHDIIERTLNNFKIELESLKEQSSKTEKIARETLDVANVIKGLTLEIQEKINQDGKVQEAETPIRFNMKPTVPLFTGREQELDNLHKLVLRKTKSSYVPQITVICGLGGIGKTQLARRYAIVYRKQFFDVVWLNAENEGLLSKSFVKLAKDWCKIPTIDANGKEMTIQVVVNKVHQFFIDRKSLNGTLIIFDNVERSYNFEKFLPINDSSAIHKETYGTTHVLITSREREWSIRNPDIKEFPLKEFGLEDAINFVHTSLNLERGNDDKIINELVESLQRFPLALEQAVAVIKDEHYENNNDPVLLPSSVTQYLKNYREETRKLLENEVFKNFSEAYENTTYATWNLTISKISKLEYGELAIKIINIIAFIAPDDIYREIFFRLEDVDESNVKKSVRLLVKYSMINKEEGQWVLSIHRLVQEVMRLRLQENGDLENYLNITMALMESWCNFDELELEEISRVLKFILPHIEALAVHLNSKNQKEISHLQKLEKALHWLAEGYDFIHDFQSLENVLVRGIEVHRILRRNDSISEANVLEYLADVYTELGKYHEALRAREQALAIFEKHGKQTLTAESHSKIADIYQATSELGKSKEHYYQALKILADHVQGNDPHVVINKLSICLSLRSVDDSRVTTDLLRQNLTYWEQYTGEMKYILSPKQLQDLGEAYMRIGDEENASKYFAESLEMCKKCNRDLFYSRMISMINYSNVRGNLGLDLEIPLVESLNIMKETQGSQHNETVKFIINFANFYFMKGDNENGFRLMEEALNIAIRNNYCEILSEILVHLGRRHDQTGEYGKALELANEGLSILESYHGKSSIKLSMALETLAFIQGNLGNTVQQRDLYDRLLLITQKQCKEGDYKLAWVQVRLGKALEVLGEVDKSKELIEKGMLILINHFGTKERAEVAASTYLTTLS